MTDSSAYQLGKLLGGVFVLLFVVMIAAVFVYCLVKALNTRKAGWVIGTVIAGVPFLLFVVLLGIGFVAGFKRAIATSTEIQAAQHNQPSVMLTAPLSILDGNTLPYQVSIPNLTDWIKKDDHKPYDHVLSYDDAYIGIIAEGLGLGNPQRLADFARKNIATRSTDYSTTTPTPVTIDSRTWLTCDVSATVRNVKIKYRYYVYSDQNYSIQIITWTTPALFEHFAPVFDRVAQTFKLPPAAR